MSTEKKTVVLKPETYEMYVRQGKYSETFDDIAVRILTLSDYLPKLKAILDNASAKLEEAKQSGKHSLACESADMLKSALVEFVKAVEAR
jgi:hypothetical protein